MVLKSARCTVDMFSLRKSRKQIQVGDQLSNIWPIIYGYYTSPSASDAHPKAQRQPDAGRDPRRWTQMNQTDRQQDTCGDPESG